MKNNTSGLLCLSLRVIRKIIPRKLMRHLCFTLCLLFLVSLLGAWLARFTEWGAFYATFPSLSRDEFDRIRAGAIAGDATSQLHYGVCYANGDGVWQDYAEAARWYEKAQSQGNATAMRNLALLYECGVGVGRDLCRAFTLYWQAAKLGEPAAHIGLAGLRLTNRESIMPRRLGDYQSWQEKAFHAIKLRIDASGIWRSFWRQYYSLDKYRQNDWAVVKLVEKEAKHESEHSLRMALFYIQGLGVEKDAGRAREWLLRAIDQDNPYAKFLLWEIDAAGSEKQIRWEQARWLREAAFSYVEPHFMLTYALQLENGQERDTLIFNLVRDGYYTALDSYSSKNMFYDSGLFNQQLHEGAKKGIPACIARYARKLAVEGKGPDDFKECAFWLSKLTDNQNYAFLRGVFGSYAKISTMHDERLDGFTDWLKTEMERGDTFSSLFVTLSLEYKTAMPKFSPEDRFYSLYYPFTLTRLKDALQGLNNACELAESGNSMGFMVMAKFSII